MAWRLDGGISFHSRNHTQNRTVRDGIADQIAAVQIENWGQIELFSEQAKVNAILAKQSALEKKLQEQEETKS